MFEIVVITLIILVLLFFLLRFPEVSFALFLIAGTFKSDPRIQNLLPEFFDLTVFFGGVVVISILYKVLKRKMHIPRISNRLFLPYLGLITIMFLSLFYTQAPIYGLDKLLRFITITTLAIFAPIFLFTNIKKFHRFLYTLVFISSLMVVESVISASGTAGFHTAFGSNYLALGRITGIASLLIIYYLFFLSNKLKGRFLFIFLFFLNFFGLLYGGGRAPVVAFFLTIVILSLSSLALKISFNQLKNFKITLLSILIGVFIIVISPKVFSTLFRRIDVLFEQKMGGRSVEKRLNSYNSAIGAFTEKPIFGLGIGGFSVYHSGVDRRSYPHNIFLEIGSELGAIGLIFLFFLLTLNFLYLFRLRRVCQKQNAYFLINGILALFIFMFLNTLVSGDINDNRLFFVWIGTAYSVGAILKREEVLVHNKQKT